MISQSKRRLVGRLRSRRSRLREGLALVEGPRVAMEALGSGATVRWGMVGEAFSATGAGAALLDAGRRRGVDLEVLPDRDVGSLGATDSPQPVVLVVEAPEPAVGDPGRGRFLLADAVQTPGNLGTLIRSAWGFGLSGVFLGAGTVDPWNDKVVRASAGGVFRIPLLALPPDFPDSGGGHSTTLYHADAAGTPVDRGDPGDWILVVGNEGRGVSERLRQGGSGLAVPLAHGVDSLNVAVAGSILMYVLTRPAASAAGPGSHGIGGASV